MFENSRKRENIMKNSSNSKRNQFVRKLAEEKIKEFMKNTFSDIECENHMDTITKMMFEMGKYCSVQGLYWECELTENSSNKEIVDKYCEEMKKELLFAVEKCFEIEETKGNPVE